MSEETGLFRHDAAGASERRGSRRGASRWTWAPSPLDDLIGAAPGEVDAELVQAAR